MDLNKVLRERTTLRTVLLSLIGIIAALFFFFIAGQGWYNKGCFQRLFAAVLDRALARVE